MTEDQKARISETIHFNVYRDVDKQWRWRALRRAFGEIFIIADGAEAYCNKSDALSTLKNMIKAIGSGNLKIAASVMVIFMLAFSAMAQPTTRATTTEGTEITTDVPTFLSEVWNTAIGQGLTNLSVTVYGTYTPSLKKWGEGFLLARNLPLGSGISTGIGVGLDCYDREFYAVSGQVSLSASLRPLSGFGGWATNVVVTPLTFIGLGTPFGESATSPGNLETLAAAGMSLHLVKVLGGSLEVQGLYGTRTGLESASGTFYGGGVSWIKRF